MRLQPPISLAKLRGLRGFLFLSFAGVVAAAPTYKDDVRPLFKTHCFKCHGPDKKKADIDLSSLAAIKAGGSGGDIVRSGSPDSSILYLAMAHAGDAETMPPKKDRLPDAQLALVKDWIAGGMIESKGGKATPAKATPSLEVDPSTLGGQPEGPPPMPENLSADAAPSVARPNPVIAMAASPWAPLVAVSGHEAVLLYNTESLEYLGALPFPERTPHELKFSRDGKLLLAAGGRGAHSGKVVVWDVVTCERVVEVGEDEIDSVLAADISADRKYIALGGTDKVLKIFEVASGKLLHRIKKHTDWVTAVEFSPDGTQVASGDRNGGIHTWEPDTGGIVFTLADHKKCITDIAWRPDGKMLATAAEDGRLILWEMEDGFPTRSATPHKGKADPKNVAYGKGDPGVVSVDMGKDAKLVTAGRDGVVRLLRNDTNPEAAIEGFEDFPTTAVFSHDGKRVVTGDFLGNIRFWEVVREKGKVRAEPLKDFSTKVAAN